MQIKSHDLVEPELILSNKKTFLNFFKFNVSLMILGPVDTSFLRSEKLRYS